MSDSRNNNSSSSSSSSSSPAPARRMMEDHYDHYLLKDNNEDTFKAVKKVVGTGNAILYYPADVSQSSHDTSTHYTITYIDGGKERKRRGYADSLAIAASIPDGESFVNFDPKKRKQNSALSHTAINQNPTAAVYASSPSRSALLKTAVSVSKKEIDVAKISQPGWDKLGPNIIRLIASQSILTTKDASHLAQTCKSLFHPIKPILDQRKLAKLAHDVVFDPNEAKVTAMLDAEPTLVNAVIKEVKDHAGRTHTNKTIFQLAYGAGNDLMCLAIKPSFVKIYGGETAGIQEMERQRNALSEESAAESLKREQKAKADLQELLKPVIAAISAELFNLGKTADNKWILSPATLAAIEIFRDEFAKSQLNQPKINGMHFRYNTLLETCETYARSAAAPWGDDYKKCALFEDGVLACVLSYVPENDAQKFSQGLYYLLDKNEPFAHEMTLRGTSNNFFSALSSPSLDFDLPFGSVDCIFGSVGREAGAAWWRRGGVWSQLALFSKLMSNKNIKLAELMQPAKPQPESRCVIC